MLLGPYWFLTNPPGTSTNCTLNPELVHSLDGDHWQRTTRTPFISNGLAGSPTAGIVECVQLLRQPDGSSHLYCTASREKHGEFHGELHKRKSEYSDTF